MWKSSAQSKPIITLLTALRSISRGGPSKRQDKPPSPIPLTYFCLQQETTALTPSRYRIAQWNPGKRHSSKAAAASAMLFSWILWCIYRLRKVNVCSCEINVPNDAGCRAAGFPLRYIFFNLFLEKYIYNFSSLPPTPWVGPRQLTPAVNHIAVTKDAVC